LSDGFFPDQKSDGYILEDLAMKMLLQIIVVWSIFRPLGNILWPFGIVEVICYILSLLSYIVPIKMWQPCLEYKVHPLEPSSRGFDALPTWR
jgi:hypothetical protein